MTDVMEGQVGWFGPDTWYGKTSPEPFQAKAELTLKKSSKKSLRSANRIPVCVCVPDGGWTKSGCYYASDGTWSIAWRVHDAQFWGVPQRRKRIALVADFGGLSAPEILFERKGLSGNFEPSGTERQGTSTGTESGAVGTISFQERAGKPGGAKESFCRMREQEPCQRSTISQSLTAGFDGSMGSKAGNIGFSEEQAITTKSTGGGALPHTPWIAVTEQKTNV